MTNYDERLNELRQKIARKKHLEYTLEDMRKQRIDLANKVKDLDAAKIKEEQDVVKLEGGSLASFFYNVVGKKDEKLDKERQEAYAAKVKYDAAYAELQALETDIESANHEWNQLLSCEDDYKRTWNEKICYLKISDTKIAAELNELEEKIAYLESQEVELQEAITAGNMAVMAAKEALNNLDSADSWSTWDLLGGGLFVDVAKHSALDDAQVSIQSLQLRLRRFKTELADITIHTDVNVKIEGFLHFADYFFDGLIVDWMVRSEIHDSVESVENIRSQIHSVLVKLITMRDKVVFEKDALKEKMDQIVLNSK
ncbi:MAG: hypothetical protein IJ471_03180 [Eubacterium sp.]|nr:hypothetical protein [Eubacterium sp.]